MEHAGTKQLPPSASCHRCSRTHTRAVRGPLQVREKDGAKAEARFVLDRMLPNLWSVGFIAMSLPDACILHVVRPKQGRALLRAAKGCVRARQAARSAGCAGSGDFL